MKRAGADRGFGRAFAPFLAVVVAAGVPSSLSVHLSAQEVAAPALAAAAEAGYDHLVNSAYLPADFDQEVFDNLWTIWEEPAKSQAATADLAERRRMTMDRYGLFPHPLDPSRAVQYVVDDAGRWTMSCLACHQGTVAGRVVPGAPNTRYALETLTEEVRQVKLLQGKPLGATPLPATTASGLARTARAVLAPRSPCPGLWHSRRPRAGRRWWQRRQCPVAA